MSSKERTLGDVAYVQGGYAFKSKDFGDKGDKVLKIKNVRNGYVDYNESACVSSNITKSLTQYKVEQDDILISMTGSGPNAPASVVGRIARVKPNEPLAFINQRIGKLVLRKEGEISKRFLYYYLSQKSISEYLVSNSTGSANQANINPKLIESIQIPNLTYKESENIASKLACLDDKIDVNNRINQTLEEIAQTLFKSWFVDFEPVKAKMKAKAEGKDSKLAAMCAISGKTAEELQQLSQEKREELAKTADLFPDKLGESELGLIPEGWGVKSLDEMIHIIGGGTPRRSYPEYWGGNIPWFSVKDVPKDSDIFIVDTDEQITELGFRKSSTKLLKVGTTIITARGTVGKLGLVGTPMAFNQSCYGIEGIEGIGAYYTFFNMRNSIVELQKKTHGAVFDTITRETFKSISCVLSESLLLIRFEEIISNLLAPMKNNLISNMTLSQARDTLLPKLLSGEINLNEK